MRPKSETYTPKWDDEQPPPFHMWSQPPGMKKHNLRLRCSVFPLPLLFSWLSSVVFINFQYVFFFHFFTRETFLLNVSKARRWKLQVAIKGRNVGTKLTQLLTFITCYSEFRAIVRQLPKVKVMIKDIYRENRTINT